MPPPTAPIAPIAARAVGSTDGRASVRREGATPIPETIGHYRVLEVLGDGVTTTVFRARADGLERVVAIKQLKSVAGPSSAFHRRFEREARTLAALHHPSLIELFDYDAGVAGERAPHMILEHVTGASLAELLKTLRRFEPEEAAAIALEVARALAYAHGRNVVHRDVKPGNVLVGATGSDLWAAPIGVKLLDFGIAIDTPRSTEAASLGQAIEGVGDTNEDDRATIGTPAYMSPEQLLGEPIDARADQFALGIVLYQLLAGVRPFDGDDGRPVLQRVRRDPPRSFKSLGVNVPKPLEKIVARLLAKRAADRYPSTHDLVVELGQFLSERVESLADLSPVHRRVLARAGVLDERKQPRAALVPRSVREGRVAGDPVALRSAPVKARAVPFAPAVVGVLVASLALVVGGGAIQLRTGGFSRVARAPAPPAMSASLESGSGFLKVRVRPWAEVVVDGQRLETTPIARAIALRPGRHVVTLIHPNETVRRTVEIVAGATNTLDVTLALMTSSSASLADEFGPPEAATSTSASAVAPSAPPSTVKP